MKIDWKAKLSSRKFWVAVMGLATSIALLFGASDSDASKVAAAAKKYLGCKESDGSHRQFIDAYNGFKQLARGYAMKYTDAWCATFVSAVSI